jgi:LPXTG-site transpeptidase (sortase) family protein
LGRIGAVFGFGVMIIGFWIGGIRFGPSTNAQPRHAPATLVSAPHVVPTVPYAGATPAATARTDSATGRPGSGGRAASASTAKAIVAPGPMTASGASAPIFAAPTAPALSQSFPWMHCDSGTRTNKVDPGSVTVVIPRLGVRAPVYDRGVAQDGTMLIAPGYSLTHLSFSARLGTWDNYVVYGHDDIEQCIFRNLASLQVGDTVEFYSGSTRYTYVVTASDRVAPTDVQVLDHTDEPIATLISCYPVGIDSQRIVVISNLVAIDEHVSVPG